MWGACKGFAYLWTGLAAALVALMLLAGVGLWLTIGNPFWAMLAFGAAVAVVGIWLVPMLIALVIGFFAKD